MGLLDDLDKSLNEADARRIERQEKQFGKKSGGTGDVYNPVLGTQVIKTKDGGSYHATTGITQGGVAVGTPVQVTPDARGATYDAKNPRTAGGDLLSTGTTQARGGTVGGGFGGGSGSGGSGGSNDPLAPVERFKPDGSGGCVAVGYPGGGVVPPGTYASLPECLDAEIKEPGSWGCFSGNCRRVNKAFGETGEYESQAECENALADQPTIYAPFDPDAKGNLVMRDAGTGDSGWVSSGFGGTWSYNEIEFYGERGNLNPLNPGQMFRYFDPVVGASGGIPTGLNNFQQSGKEYGIYIPGIATTPRRKCPD
jgi:hypothetical protein